MKGTRNPRQVGWAVTAILAGTLAAGCGGRETIGTADAGGRLDARIGSDGATTDALSPVDGGHGDVGTERDAGTDAPALCTDDAACDDADPCTTDRCTATDCEHVPFDGDGDGFGAGVVGITMCADGNDCDDTDAAVHPGALELCNGRDENCDGVVDDGFECASPGSDACTTSCGSTGTRACNPATCGWGPCEPPAETCDGFDEDCDAAADEDFECARFSGGSCPTTCGSTGSWSCSTTCTRSTCTPPAETCNALDDDCDGVIDDGFTCARDATTPCTTSCGGVGYRICLVGCTWSSCIAPSETCNGLDDDCNGSRDDGFACVAGSTGTCASVCGSTGTRMCDPTTCAWGSCAPPGETCNGADDDCDGLPDETFSCARGATGACTSSCGTTGTRACSAVCAWSACTPPAEVCNGVDDDCDSWADDGFTCSRGATRSCFTGCGTTGTETCNASCGWGTCTPPAEACNGRDDDCDGAPDDGLACVQYATRPCMTTCGTTGTQSCSVSCAWGACAPPPDLCNGIDDDCDGVVDNGIGGCGVDQVCTAGACRPTPPRCSGYRYAGHAYAVCRDDVSWASARGSCTSYGGHLVTITSSAEHSFLRPLLTERAWHGLSRGASCTWQWVTGEPVSYTAWEPAQPSSACGDQDCGDFWYGPNYLWDDYWCAMNAGFVCEWDA